MDCDYTEIILKTEANLSEKSEYSKNGVAYGIHELYEFKTWKEKTEQMAKCDWHFEQGELVFAHDASGNYFTIQNDGSIWFLDHETDERTALAKDLDEFIHGLHAPEKITLPPHKVLKVWVNPDFKPKFR
jgi:hypothetical protein